MATYLLFLLAGPIVGRIPHRVLSAVGRAFGLVLYALTPSARRAVERNLSVVLPTHAGTQRRRLAAQVFVHGAWSYIEQLSISSLTPNELRANYKVTGWENLDRALSAGRGAIMVTAHLGSPVLGTQLVALRGVPTTVAVEPIRPAALFRLMVRLRGTFGLRLVAPDRGLVGDLVATLRRNEIVGLICDRDIAGAGKVLPFFGVPTHVTTAPATLALRTGAPVLPCVILRTSPFHGVAHIGDPIELVRTGRTRADVVRGTLEIMAHFERYIAQRPEQWVVFSDVWPRRAEGDDNVSYNAGQGARTPQGSSET